MPANADLTLFLAASRPEDDVSTSGGARATTWRPLDDQLTSNDTIRVRSSSAGDTRNVTITGRLATGAIDTEVLALNGTANVDGAKTFERILKIEAASADGARTVTVVNTAEDDFATTIEPDHIGRMINFYAAASEASPVDREEKVFAHNDAADDLNDATVDLTSDPATKLKFGVVAAKDDSTSITDRLTQTFSRTMFDDNNAQAVPSGVLGAGEAIGVIIEQELLAADSPVKDSYQVTIAGTSTT